MWPFPIPLPKPPETIPCGCGLELKKTYRKDGFQFYGCKCAKPRTGCAKEK